jgi:hypothetical protein
MIGNRAVTPLNDEVAGFASTVLSHRPLEDVLEFDDRVVRRDAEPERMGPAFGRRLAAASAWVDRFRRRVSDLGGCNYRTAAPAGISAAGGLKAPHGLGVGIDSI